MFKNNLFTVQHEVGEGVSAGRTGGKLHARDDLRCHKNKLLQHHQNFIPANEFKEEHISTWESKLSGKLTLSDCFKMIQLLIPLCVRLDNRFVSEKRPGEGYPFFEHRGTQNRMFGSGLVSSVKSMSDKCVCVDCGTESNARCEQGVFECPDCQVRWRMISEENRKCPECNSETSDLEKGLLTCSNKYCLWRVNQYTWRVMNDEVGGRCPKCEVVWFEVDGNKLSARCRKCKKMVRKCCVCHTCLAKEDREKKWWEICIETARHVIFDTEEWVTCDVILFDDGMNNPIKMKVGKGGHVDDRLTSTHADCCQLYVYTCDRDVVGQLEKMITEMRAMSNKMLILQRSGRNIGKSSQKRSYKKNVASASSTDKCGSQTGECSENNSDECSGKNSVECSDSDLPIVLIGYPHGKQCYVSLGTSITKLHYDRKRYNVQYRVDSCAGYSGGLVWRLRDELFQVYKGYHHHGCLKEQPDVGTTTSWYSVLN